MRKPALWPDVKGVYRHDWKELRKFGLTMNVNRNNIGNRTYSFTRYHLHSVGISQVPLVDAT